MDIEAWDKLAEVCQKYVVKGQQIYVEGRFKTDKYTDREGVSRSKVRVVANSLLLLGKKNDDSAEPAQRVAEKRPVTESDPIDDFDIPF